MESFIIDKYAILWCNFDASLSRSSVRENRVIKVPYIYSSMTELSVSEKADVRKFCAQMSDLCRRRMGGSFVHHEHHEVPFTELTPDQADLIIRNRLGRLTSLFIAVAGEYSFDLGVMIEMAYRSDVPVVVIGHQFRFYNGAIPKLLGGNPGIKKRIAYERYDDALPTLEDFIITNFER